MFNNIIGANNNNTLNHGGTETEFPRLQALEIIKTVILSSIYSKKLLKLEPETLKILFAKAAEVKINFYYDLVFLFFIII